MSLCQRTMLLAVVLVSCTLLLPTTLGRSHSRQIHDARDGEIELRDLLEQLRQKLEKDEGASEKHFGSIHDDFNEERSLLDDVRSSRGESRGTGLHSHRVKTVRQDTTLTTDQQAQLVDEMNSKRRSVGAADMYKLHWNTKLAGLAQDWASKCQYVHGYTPYNADEYDNFSVLGANLWAYQGPFDASKIVDNWYKDHVNFNRVTQNCEEEATCGGYKQLVTSYTTDVGCGLSACSSISSGSSSLSDANFIVCYFGPAGNYRRVATFKAGPPCTLCKYGQFYCDDGLCDKTCTAPGTNCVCKANCKQCGIPTADCRCACNAGSYGVDCGLPCADRDEQSPPREKCGKRGFTEVECKNPHFQFVRDKCPLLCGQCVEGDPCGGSNGGGSNDVAHGDAGGEQQSDDDGYVYFND